MRTAWENVQSWAARHGGRTRRSGAHSTVIARVDYRGHVVTFCEDTECADETQLEVRAAPFGAWARPYASLWPASSIIAVVRAHAPAQVARFEAVVGSRPAWIRTDTLYIRVADRILEEAGVEAVVTTACDLAQSLHALDRAIDEAHPRPAWLRWLGGRYMPVVIAAVVVGLGLVGALLARR